MSFSWTEYLVLAEALVRHRATFAPEEACCRAAISRAYYAAYGGARNYARDGEGLVLGHSGEDHALVLGRFRQGPSRAHRRMYWLLFRLRGLRDQADYADSL